MSNKPTNSGPITLRTPLGDASAGSASKPPEQVPPAAPPSVPGSLALPGQQPGIPPGGPASAPASRSSVAMPPSFGKPPSVSTMGPPGLAPPDRFGSTSAGAADRFGSASAGVPKPMPTSSPARSTGSFTGFGGSGSGASDRFSSSPGGASDRFGSGSMGASDRFGSGSMGAADRLGSASAGVGGPGSGGGGSSGGGAGSGPGGSGNGSSPLARDVLRILGRHLSQMLARQMLDRALQQIGRSQAQLVTADMPRLVDAIVRDARAFLESNNVNRLKTDLESLLPESARIRGPLDLEIRVESDIAQARMAAKEICESLGGNRLAVQRAATIVSEITRNMVSYAGGGRVELIPRPRPGAAILIRAADHGPGIKNLPEIMDGKYKSRTGLGLGILAAKRLSDHFEIESDPSGTRIVVEVRL